MAESDSEAIQSNATKSKALQRSPSAPENAAKDAVDGHGVDSENDINPHGPSGSGSISDSQSVGPNAPEVVVDSDANDADLPNDAPNSPADSVSSAGSGSEARSPRSFMYQRRTTYRTLSRAKRSQSTTSEPPPTITSPKSAENNKRSKKKGRSQTREDVPIMDDDLDDLGDMGGMGDRGGIWEPPIRSPFGTQELGSSI